MTRPQIIRADTIDLQDKTSPTAQDHSRQPQHPAPLGIGPAAPHQEAALQAVSDERTSEEAHLQQSQQSAYGYANSLRDDPGSDDERTLVDHNQSQNGDNGHVHDEQAVRLNGGSMGGGVDDGEMQDADVDDDDMDDDMMDKISSSPSITDGQYELPSPTTGWPQRTSSLTPTSTPVPSPNQSSASHEGSSSPFMTTPIHFPLSIAGARRHFHVPAASASSSSMAISRPVPSPLRSLQSAEHHHHHGKYERAMGSMSRVNAKFLPDRGGDDNPTSTTDFRAQMEGRIQNMRNISQWSLSSDSSDTSATTVLVPLRSPLQESFEHSLGNSGTADDEVAGKPCSNAPAEPDDANDGPGGGPLLGANGKPLFGTTSRSEHELRMRAPPPHILPEFNQSSGKGSAVPTSTPNQEHRANTPRPSVSPGSDEPEDYESWTTDSDADSWDMNSGDDDDDDDSSDDFSFSDDSRYVDYGWGCECLHEVEDIDFEFVYALHTFVATVEGQANATKGDTMVLLDDSNSYWWLVRVVKDSSIGYLPAEHIETPTERLARLNKHRNIDLSATMLGDTIEKTKNPLKKAYRRKNAKTVQFAPPTYVEASEYDYSSDEDNSDELFGGADPTQNQAQAQAATEKAEPEQEEGLKVQPLKLGAKKDAKDGSEAEQDGKDEAKTSSEKSRNSDEEVERPLDPKVTRNGTLRNTDSFFRDDNVETRKITLTPNLLRDDSSTSTTGSRERGPSLESLEKSNPADKAKEEKKKKDKKPGMLRGLFGRKEKKPKGSSESIDSDTEKVSEEVGRSSPQSKASEDTPSDRPSTEPIASATSSATSSAAPSRQSSKGKLQKTPRGREESPSKPKKGILRDTSDSPEPSTLSQVPSKDTTSSATGTKTPSTMRMVSPERDETPKSTITERVVSPEVRSRSNSALSKVNPINMLNHRQQDGEHRPEKVKKAKQRIQLDDFDSEEEEKADPFADPKEAQKAPSAAGPVDAEPAGRLSESPVHISAADAQPPAGSKEPLSVNTQQAHAQQDKELEVDAQHPPGLTADTSSAETPSPISTPTPGDSPIDNAPSKPNITASRPTVSASPSPTLLAPAQASTIPPPSRPAPIPKEMLENTPPTSSESHSLPAWSDASLRSYLDDGSDIRDMLMVINDTTGVVPVGRDHPLMSNLYVEEEKAVERLGVELDGMLMGWMERKRKKREESERTPSNPQTQGLAGTQTQNHGLGLSGGGR